MDGLCECGCGQATAISPRTSTLHGYVKGRPRRFVKGHNRQGTRWSEARRGNVAAALRGRKRPEITGEANPAWKGAAVSYEVLHEWVRRHKTKTGICSTCGDSGRRTEWANVSGEYRRDLDDFREMCCICHSAHDRALGMGRWGATA